MVGGLFLLAFAQDNLMSRRVGEMKSYLFPIYSALKLLLVVSLLVLVSDLARAEMASTRSHWARAFASAIADV